MSELHLLNNVPRTELLSFFTYYGRMWGESTTPHDPTYALKGLSNRQLGFWVSRDLTGKGNDRGGSVQQIPLNMYYIQNESNFEVGVL